MRLMPRIKDYMTRQPYSIEDSASIAQAEQVMRKYNVRHLPVLNNTKVVGVISDRDIKSVASIKASPDTLQIKFILRDKPYIVDPNTTLDEVSKMMAQHHYGSAVVIEKNVLVGIFTTVDACRALAEILENYLTDTD